MAFNPIITREPRTGRLQKEDNSFINEADYLAGKASGTIADKTTPVQEVGTATGGTINTIADTTKNWVTNAYEGYGVYVNISGIDYQAIIKSNTTDELEFFGNLPTAVLAGSNYAIFKIPKFVLSETGEPIQTVSNVTYQAGFNITRDAFKLYHIAAKSVNTTTYVTVDSTVGGTEILPANSNRKSVSLQNNGTQVVFLAFDGVVPVIASKTFHRIIPVASGVNIGDGGDFYSDEITGQILAITSAGSTDIHITELNY